MRLIDFLVEYREAVEEETERRARIQNRQTVVTPFKFAGKRH